MCSTTVSYTHLDVYKRQDIDSLDELAANADKFGGEIIGIEPGAGLTGVTQDSMMPAYGLDGKYELITSSTATMLTELGSAIEKKKDIVVTLWRPFWAYNEYDVKDLKDPLGAMGDSEALHFLGKQGFAEPVSYTHLELAVESHLPVAVTDDQDRLIGVVPRVTLLAALADLPTTTTEIPIIEPTPDVSAAAITEALQGGSAEVDSDDWKEAQQ